MSSFFNHLFIPLVILLLFYKQFNIDFKKVLIFSFVAVLPDADYFFPPHRALIHNVFILIIPFLFLILKKDMRETLIIICFYYLTHLILDIFNGGIYILYPIYDKVIFVNMGIGLSFHNLTYLLDWGINNKIVNIGIGELMISSENIGTTIILIICLCIWIIKKQRV